jgi:ribosomal protein S18 acetylase RimI-like enzyme
MDLIIRSAADTDADEVAGLYLRARRAAADSGSIPAPAHSDHEVSDWIRLVVIPRLECWLAQTPAGEVVGLLVVEGDWIDQLYVDPDLTGRGIGAQLLDLAKRERPHGLTLWTFVSNDGAQRFYERHGFSEAERTDGTRNEERAPDIRFVWKGSVPPGNRRLTGRATAAYSPSYAADRTVPRQPLQTDRIWRNGLDPLRRT